MYVIQKYKYYKRCFDFIFVKMLVIKFYNSGFEIQ